MGASVVDAFLRGHRGAWIGLLVALVVTAAIALAHRGRASPGRVILLSALVSGLSAAGILVATALSVPRIVWQRAPTPPFAAASGDAWRTLRAPSATLLVQGRPEVGLAGVDAAGRVRLYGLFSGAPLDGFADATAAPPAPGGPRICEIAAEKCRAWPREWPEPAAPSGSDFVWTRDLGSKALAYDVETGFLLHHVEGLRPAGAPVAMAGTATPAVPPSRDRGTSGSWALEQVGKLTSEPSRDGPTVLFVVRRIVDDRLEAARIVAAPSGDTYAYSFERAGVSLTAAPRAFAWFARPLLLALVLWFPVVTLLLQAAPAWWASRRRKRIAANEPVSEMPADPARFTAAARAAMAERLAGPALLAVGLAVAAPAVVAVVGLVAGR